MIIKELQWVVWDWSGSRGESNWTWDECAITETMHRLQMFQRAMDGQVVEDAYGDSCDGYQEAGRSMSTVYGVYKQCNAQQFKGLEIQMMTGKHDDYIPSSELVQLSADFFFFFA